MKKNQMIAETLKLEATYWLALQKAQTDRGVDDPLTEKMRFRWSAMDQLLTVLGISSDLTLPDNKAATALVMARVEKQKDLVELIKY
jgi:hypothetical protein